MKRTLTLAVNCIIANIHRNDSSYDLMKGYSTENRNCRIWFLPYSSPEFRSCQLHTNSTCGLSYTKASFSVLNLEMLNICEREEPLTQIDRTEEPKINAHGVVFTVINIMAMILVFSYYFSKRRFEGEIRQITRQKLGPGLQKKTLKLKKL